MIWESEMIRRSRSGLEDLRKVEFETKLDKVPTFRIITILRRLSCHLLQPLQSTQFVVGAIAVPLAEIQKNWLVLKDLTLLWIHVMEGKYLIKIIQNSFWFDLGLRGTGFLQFFFPNDRVVSEKSHFLIIAI